MRRRPLRTVILTCLVLTAGSLTVGCGGDDDGDDAAASSSGAGSAAATSAAAGKDDVALLTASDNEFAPVTARPGQTVRLVSGDPVPHTAVSVDDAWTFDELKTTFQAPDEPGTYDFYCGVHGKGMAGTLTVAP